MGTAQPYRITSISEIHRLMSLPKPHHPLISIVDLHGLKDDHGIDAVIFDLYVISLKRGCDGLYYGQQKYDFEEGLMAFMAPGQVLRGDRNGMPANLEGWMLFIHPDFLWNSTLATKIKRYDYFDYATHEALFLSDREEMLINEIAGNIRIEYQANLDKFSQDIIISHIATLLNYADRFYQRQFITRKISNHTILERLELLLEDYFKNDDLISRGLPSVRFICEELNVSPGYLRGLLKILTGQNTQQLIHDKLIEKAKQQLSGTSLSVSEIAFGLGFEHMQSFSKFFKAKTRQSPLEFRSGFN